MSIFEIVRYHFVIGVVVSVLLFEDGAVALFQRIVQKLVHIVQGVIVKVVIRLLRR